MKTDETEMLKRLFIILAGIILANCAFASLNQLPVRNINGKNYYVYQVQPGEGELAIAKKLDINVKDIKKYNPDAENGLKAYQELFFPVPKAKEKEIKKQQEKYSNLPETHTAKKGESLYGICKKYGIDETYFINLNPEAADGIIADRTYRLKPEFQEPAFASADSKTKKYAIGRSESLYSIAQANGCTIEEILSLNPDLNPTYYQEGQVITIPIKGSDAASKVENAFKKHPQTYVVRPNDTFYSIARNFGVSIAQLQAANPDLNLLREGMEIVIPDSCAEETSNGSTEIQEQNQPKFSWQEIPKVHTKEPIKIAIVLPFNASAKPHPKNSKNYVDFYRGFMLAVDSFKIGEQPVAVYAYDTESNADKIRNLKRDSLINTASIIISAGSLENCEELDAFGKANNINILNIFSVRDTSYLTNRNVMQGNIPSNELVDLTVNYVGSNLTDYTPVILEVSGAKDKLSIANRIANAIETDGVPVKRLKLSDKPSASDFKVLNTAKKYLFIPTTSKIEFTKELLKALTAESNQKLLDNGGTLFGYPEWITLREKSTISNLKKLNTYIYSRFAEPNEFEKERVDASHKHWYGKGVSTGVPSMTLTGFDVGKFLLKALEENRGNFDMITLSNDYEGLQYPFYFKRVGNGGYVNCAAYIIHFVRDGEIENILIKE